MKSHHYSLSGPAEASRGQRQVKKFVIVLFEMCMMYVFVSKELVASLFSAYRRASFPIFCSLFNVCLRSK